MLLSVHLTGVLLADARISGTHHIAGDHFLCVIGVFDACFIVQNGYFDFLQQTRWFAIFLQGAPAGGNALGFHIQIICRHMKKTKRKKYNRKIRLTRKIGLDRRHAPALVGIQIGRMKSVIGTRSFKRNSAMSLSKLVKLNSWAMARNTNRVSGRSESLQRSCSPNVTLIMNHMNL